ncbi:hypothetical protein Sa4125_17650 [Aureimonas sp. SA4125]|uniref:DUF2188 domain-containing protein n=1 Tax=Aureimonas sp. SA4125 TaxID=2826993 RepID=UPI001CC53325|nr:DUF2188 domain-containing protein [Aureimonas sp. SA4125]BDA84223.1 hypothetical protein Sa4125_17650 [Aureimonas sp. SA4125]
MAKASKGKAASPYRLVGKTYDGVRVLAPKAKSKTFTEPQVKRAIRKALDEVGGASTAIPLRETDALRVEQRADGKFGVKRKGTKRASTVVDTQTDAITNAKDWILERRRSRSASVDRTPERRARGARRETPGGASGEREDSVLNDLDVFIDCPFDDTYNAIFNAIV